MVGQVVHCPKCQAATIVPEQDDLLVLPANQSAVDEGIEQKAPHGGEPDLSDGGAANQDGGDEGREEDSLGEQVHRGDQAGQLGSPFAEWVEPAPAPREQANEDDALAETSAAEPDEQRASGAQRKRKRAPVGQLRATAAEEGASDTLEDEEPESSGGFAFGRRQLDTEEMDLTPMVDMTFLLLIFFMITASFSLQKSIEVPPPSPEEKGAAQTLHSLDELENTSVIVRIDDRNAIFVDDEPVADRAKLAQALRSTMRSTSRTELVLSASAGAFHETVIAVIDAANEVGMQKIRLATHGGGGS